MIVRPTAPSPAATETLSRLRGELLAVGLTVEVVARSALRSSDGSSSRAWLEQVAAERHVDGALDIIDTGAPASGATPVLAAVDVWTFSREPHHSEVTHVVAEPGVESSLERMAIRSVEVLRSSLVGDGPGEDAGGATAGPPRPAPASAALRREAEAGRNAEPSPPPPTETSLRLGLELGAALIAPSLDGVATAIAPLVRVNGAAGAAPVSLQIEVAGFGSRPEASNQSGSARIAQQHALAGLCTCGPSLRRLRPTFALSAGALHTSVEGRAAGPGQGHAVAQWSFLLQASLGARVVAYARYELSLAVHVQVAEPYVAVYVVDDAVAVLGRPALGLTLTLGGWR